MIISIIHKVILSLSTLVKRLTTKHLKVGHNTVIYPTCNISTRYSKWGGVIIGDNCRIGNFPSGYKIGWYRPTRISTRGVEAKIVIGNQSEINGANIYARELVEIGDHAEIASGVQITDFNGHLTYSLNRTIGEDIPQPVRIGKNVWIGLNSIILKGTNIGNNAIIAPNSVVKGEFPPYSLIMGNPAKLVKILDTHKFS